MLDHERLRVCQVAIAFAELALGIIERIPQVRASSEDRDKALLIEIVRCGRDLHVQVQVLTLRCKWK